MKVSEGLEVVAKVIKSSLGRLDERGREVVDGRPMAPPVGYKPEVPLALQIREMVRSERFAQAASEAGAETFEEANDFYIEDDPESHSKYEFDEDAELDLQDLMSTDRFTDEQLQAEIDRRKAAEPKAKAKKKSSDDDDLE